jgi:hypothetical protein
LRPTVNRPQLLLRVHLKVPPTLSVAPGDAARAAPLAYIVTSLAGAPLKRR